MPIANTEAVLLYRLVTAPDADAARASVDAQMARRRIDWRRLVAQALLDNAVTVLHARIHMLPPGTMPADARAWLDSLSFAWTLRLHQLERRLADVLALLNEEEIPVTLLKGAALATTIYQGFVDRPMADLDLLVAPSDARRAHTLLQAHGWSPIGHDLSADAWDAHHHLTPLLDRSGSGLRLELHSAPLEPGNPFTFDFTREGATKHVVVHGHRARVAKPHVHAVHSAAHFAWGHSFESGALNAFRDLAQLARAGALDWDRYVAAAREAGAESACYWTARLARAAVDFDVPDGVLEALAPARPETVLRMLEHHFLQVAHRDRTGCPSVRVRQRLWALALGTPLPARDPRLWLAPSREQGAHSRLQRMSTQLRLVPRWSQYAASMIGSAIRAEA